MTPDDQEEATKRTTLRLPEGLYDAVSKKANEKHRSLNQEIVSELYDHLMGSDPDVEKERRDQLLGFFTGALLATSLNPPKVEGFTPEQVETVIEALVEYFRDSYRKDKE